jgi:hypothetical protein
LLAKTTSDPSGETKACWSVLPVQSTWDGVGLATLGETWNSSLLVYGLHGASPDAVL